ncbi:SMI1/KNR4 family protein [Polyangium fumosum]|nr:SMI1/KNR4 family protein [Polyangium fumosum]
MQIHDRGEPLSEQSLQELEEKLGVRLPAPYRRFLQEYNGGRPEPDVLDIAGAPFGTVGVREFFGVGKDYETYELLWLLEERRASLGDDVLAIACDSSGDLYGIVTKGEQRGRVYFFDYYASWEPYFVASDFDAFLQKLRPLTPEELALIEAGAATAVVVDLDKPVE